MPSHTSAPCDPPLPPSPRRYTSLGLPYSFQRVPRVEDLVVMLQRSPIVQAPRVRCGVMGGGLQGQEPGAHHRLCHRCGHQCCCVWVPGTGVSAPRRHWSCTGCCGPTGCQPGERSAELGEVGMEPCGAG